MILIKQLIAEVEQISDNKITEIYDLIHNFRLGLTQENPKNTPKFGFAKGIFKMTYDFDEPLGFYVMYCLN